MSQLSDMQDRKYLTAQRREFKEWQMLVAVLYLRLMMVGRGLTASIIAVQYSCICVPGASDHLQMTNAVILELERVRSRG